MPSCKTNLSARISPGAQCGPVQPPSAAPGLDRASEAPICRPMVAIAAILAAGIALGAVFPGRCTAGLGVAAVAGLALIRGMVQGRGQAAAPLFLILSLGYLSLQPWLAPRQQPGHAARYAGGQAVPIQGTVHETPRVTAGRQKFTLSLQKPEGRSEDAPFRGLVRVTVQGLTPAFSQGETLAFTARLRSPRNFNNPGGFDYRRYLYLQGVQVSAYVTADRVRCLHTAPAAGMHRAGERYRNRIGALIDKSSGADTAAVLRALTIGDRSKVFQALRNAFNRTGVGHLLAISGLHVGIVAALVYGFSIRLLVWWPLMVERAWSAKSAALFTAAAVWGYSLLAGFAPSTQRAAMMASAYLAALLLERDPDLPSTLALAALIILTVHPPALFSVSFQLSFAAVGWILAGVRPSLKLAGCGPVRRIGGWARQFLLVSFWAVLGTLPLVMQTFNQVSLVGLAANFVFVPWIGMLVVPLGLGAALTALISPGASLWIFKICAVILDPALKLMYLLADWPPSAISTFTPRPVEIGLYYAVLALILVCWRHRQAFRVRSLVAAGVLVVAGLTADGLYWGHRRFWHQDLRATILDVGQGAAAVIEAPGGRVFLVDGGGFGDNAVFDVGRRIVAPFLRYQKIRTLDLVVLTHADADHLNGLLYVFDTFPVGAFWSNREASDTLGYRTMAETVARRKIDWPCFDALARSRFFGPTLVELLYPAPDFLERITSEPWRRGNNSSIVVRISAAGRSMLWTGDIQAPAEAELIACNQAALKADLLALAHHGSRSSNTGPFLDAVRPAMAVVSCGWHNRYGLPHREVIQRLGQRGIDLWRTDRDGAVLVHFTDQAVRVHPFLSPGQDGQRRVWVP